MNSVFAAKTAILVHFEPVRVILLVLCSVVVALLAFSTSQSNLNSHLLSAPPVDREIFCLPLVSRAFTCGPKKERTKKEPSERYEYNNTYKRTKSIDLMQ